MSFELIFLLRDSLSQDKLFLGAEMTMMAMVQVRDAPKKEACVGVFSATLKYKSCLLLPA